MSTRTTAHLALLLVAAVAAGCGDGTGPGPTDTAPKDLLAAAATEALRAPTHEVTIAAVSRGGEFTGRGLIELRDGRFEVEVDAERGEMGIDPPETVIGTDGEGAENTFAVGSQGIGPDLLGPCWFNPHAPVGSWLGTVSVEESARLSGAVVESMAGDEIASARQAPEGGTFLVRLTASASKPRDDFDETKRRTWGARALLPARAPIAVRLDDEGALAGLEIPVRGYEPFLTAAGDADPVGSATVTATFAVTDRELRIDEPSCQAVE